MQSPSLPSQHSPTQLLLYHDVLHSIFAFLLPSNIALAASSSSISIPRSEYLTILLAASTCRQWMHACETMKISNLPSSSHPDIGIDLLLPNRHAVYESGSGANLLHDVKFISLSALSSFTISQLHQLTQSRLRHLVNQVHVHDESVWMFILPRLDQLQLAETMPNLRTLQLTLSFGDNCRFELEPYYVDKEEKEKVDEEEEEEEEEETKETAKAKAKEKEKQNEEEEEEDDDEKKDGEQEDLAEAEAGTPTLPSFGLPSSLRHLRLTFIARCFIDAARSTSEEPEEGCWEEPRMHAYKQIGRVTRMLASGAKVSSPHLESLSCAFYSHNGYHSYGDVLGMLPSCALRPFMTIRSITHLTLGELSNEACDLVHEWSAIKRIDLNSNPYEAMLQRLVEGNSNDSEDEDDDEDEDEDENQISIDFTTHPPGPPPVVRVYLYNCDSNILSLLSRFSLTITDLNLSSARCDPSDMTLSHLPLLIRFAWSCDASAFVKPNLIVNGIVKHISQLQHLELRGMKVDFTHEHMRDIVKHLSKLRSLLLEEVTTITHLDWIVDASSLIFDVLNIKKLKLTATSREKIEQLTQPIKRLSISECTFAAKTNVVVPPAARLVGIE